MIYAIFRVEENRMIGHATGNYSSNSDDEVAVDTTVKELSEVFANAGVDELAGPDDPIEDAIEDPLSYRDYLILDEDDEIVFDDAYARSDEV